MKRKRLWHPESHALFLPIDVPPAAEPEEVVPGPAPSPDFVEIVLRNGRQLRVSGGLGDAALARLIRLVEAA